MSRIDRFLRNVVVALVALSLLAAGAVAAKKPPKPAEFVPGSWTLVLLPDTQSYADEYPGLFTMQTHWIAKNKDKLQHPLRREVGRHHRARYRSRVATCSRGD